MVADLVDAAESQIAKCNHVHIVLYTDVYSLI